jgi:hypothetical protein
MLSPFRLHLPAEVIDQVPNTFVFASRDTLSTLLGTVVTLVCGSLQQVRTATRTRPGACVTLVTVEGDDQLHVLQTRL